MFRTIQYPNLSIAQYGVILDAGSSGTRIYVYKWKHPALAKEKASSPDLKSLPRLKIKESKKIHPGISTFADNVSSVGPYHLQDLIDVAIDKVPSDKIPETPIFLMATAGVRFLPEQKQKDLLAGVCTYLQANTRFSLPDCESHIQVIPGETEGLYGWLATNYLLGAFDKPETNDHGDNHHTYGFLDMGGASAQIAFSPNSTEAEKHSNDLKLVRMRHIDGSSTEYKVFTATWLGFGANKARVRFVDSLTDEYGDDAKELPDPCLPEGLRTTLEGEFVEGSPLSVLVGTGTFDECLRKTYPLLGKDAPCDDHPCLLDGQHVPAIDFDINHFVGVSEYWHMTHGIFGSKQKAYDLAAYQHAVMDFCSRSWSDIEADYTKDGKLEKLEDAREACFKASWVINMLYEGIGIPRVGLEGVSGSHNVTKEIADKAKEKGLGDPFQPIDTIDGVELSWTLGKIILYAAGQVQPIEATALPVGFGSNVGDGKPEDFEMAGSSPLSPDTIIGHDDDDDDWDDLLEKPSKSSGALILILVILVIAAFLLRKPERRRRLVNVMKRQRRPPGFRKGGFGFSFTKKIFGRTGPGYERILEDGDGSDFELRSADEDDAYFSDSPDGLRAGKTSGMATPKLNPDRVEDLRLPSALDRTGLVARTGSCERLGPPLQMLNAGRRSRAGSPTRQRS